MKDSPHGYELGSFLINVLLVDLIGENDDAVLMANFYYLLEALSLHDLSGWISRVDDDHGSGADTVVLGLFDFCSQGVCVERPALVLFQVVGK